MYSPIEQRLLPHEREIEDRDEIPRALVGEMAGAGLFGVGFAVLLRRLEARGVNAAARDTAPVETGRSAVIVMA